MLYEVITDPDIETIVGKALEKDADRRYASASALSEDIARNIVGNPATAVGNQLAGIDQGHVRVRIRNNFV